MARLLLCFKPLTRDGEDSGHETISTHHSHPNTAPQGHTHSHPSAQQIHSSDSGTSQEPRKTVAFVEILKRRNEPLGLVLKGGTDYNRPVYVGQLYPGGAAEKSGALQLGDFIRGINGTATDHLNQKEVNALLSNSGNVVNLEIEFNAPPGSDVDDGTVKKTALIKLRRERNSFGFTISGGRTENRPVTVSNVTVGSMAYKQGVLKAGDRILKINRNDVSSSSQMETLSLLTASDDLCALEIEYDVTVHEGLNEYRGQLLVEILKPKGASLGIGLQESSSPDGGPLIVSKIKGAGIADRCGALHVGDRLLSVNKEGLEARSIIDVQHLLKHCDLNVELEIIPAHNFPQRLESLTGSVSHVSRLSAQRDTPSMMSYSSLATSVTCHPETMQVTLVADDIGYGLSLEGGTTERSVYPILISSIEDGGPAAKLGQLQVGDQILAIDGIQMDGYSLQEAMKLVQEADDGIQMEIKYEVQDSSPPSSGVFDVHMKKQTASLNLGITINGSRSRGDTIWVSSLKKGGIAYRSGMLRSGDVLLEINGHSLKNCNLREAAQLLMAAGESVNLCISKENTVATVTAPPAASEPVIYSVELHRNKQSLGITLVGNREHEGHPITILKVKEDGVAYKTGALKAGDHILAINGESLYNKTLPEAVAMLNSVEDIVHLKISKASRKLKARQKSPTGRHRGPHHHHHYGGGSPSGREYGGRGFPVRHRESFGSSSGSSFMGSHHTGRATLQSLNYRRKYSFEPVLGESASRSNTPVNLSLMETVPPTPTSLYEGARGVATGGHYHRQSSSNYNHTPLSLYTDQLEGGGRGRGRMSGNHTPLSELSGTSAFMQMGNGISSVYSYQPHLTSQSVQPLDDDQLSSISGRSRQTPHYPQATPIKGQFTPKAQYLMRRQKSAGATMSTMRDSLTDDEMSSYDLEGQHAKYGRRSSLPEKGLYSSSTPGYAVTRTGDTHRHHHGNSPGMMWNFKTRGHTQKPPIPVGRVSPITPTETERLSTVAPHQPLKEGGVQIKPEYNPLFPHGVLSSPAPTPAAIGKGIPLLSVPQLSTKTPQPQELTPLPPQNSSSSVPGEHGTMPIPQGASATEKIPLPPKASAGCDGDGDDDGDGDGDGPQVRPLAHMQVSTGFVAPIQHDTAQVETRGDDDDEEEESDMPPPAAADSLPADQDFMGEPGHAVPDVTTSEELPESAPVFPTGVKSSAVSSNSQANSETTPPPPQRASPVPTLVVEATGVTSSSESPPTEAAIDDTIHRHNESDQSEHTVELSDHTECDDATNNTNTKLNADIRLDVATNTTPTTDVPAGELDTDVRLDGATIPTDTPADGATPTTDKLDTDNRLTKTPAKGPNMNTDPILDEATPLTDTTVLRHATPTKRNTNHFRPAGDAVTASLPSTLKYESTRHESIMLATTPALEPVKQVSLARQGSIRHDDHPYSHHAPNHTPSATYQSDSSNATKLINDTNLHLPPLPPSSSSYHPTKNSSPYSSFRRRGKASNNTAIATDSLRHSGRSRSDRSPPRKPVPSLPLSNNTRLMMSVAPPTGAGATAATHVPSLREYKKMIDHADEFGKAMAALAESGSSDQDSDSEPRSKLSGLPVHEQTKVREKMQAPQSSVLHQVVVSKVPGEVSFGFSISDGQYDQGVYVKTLKPGGPSERGGLQQYDKLVQVNDVILSPDHKCSNVYPLLKKRVHDLTLIVSRQA